MGSPEERDRKIHEKKKIWADAEVLVGPIIIFHGLKGYIAGVDDGHRTTITPVDQHVDTIIRVAEWLLGEES